MQNIYSTERYIGYIIVWMYFAFYILKFLNDIGNICEKHTKPNLQTVFASCNLSYYSQVY